MTRKMIFVVLFAELCFLSTLFAADSEGKRIISFSGYDWLVKSYSYPMGPGPNYFSASADNVWVDERGFLHLRITKRGGLWQCAEVIATRHFGFGKYSFKIESAVDTMDPNIVLGLFIYEYASAHAHHREIDIEISRWGIKDARNAQYTVQPFAKDSNKHSFFLGSGQRGTVHSFRWKKNKITFLTHGQKKWVYKGPDIPSEGRETPRINLWLFRGEEPFDGKEFEVVIEKFIFTP